MTRVLLLGLVLLSGCSRYKCIDGKVYSYLDNDTWIEAGIWTGAKCITVETK